MGRGQKLSKIAWRHLWTTPTVQKMSYQKLKSVDLKTAYSAFGVRRLAFLRNDIPTNSEENLYLFLRCNLNKARKTLAYSFEAWTRSQLPPFRLVSVSVLIDVSEFP